MTTTTQTKRPTHIIYQVTGEAETTFWNRVGAAWLDKDGRGFSLRLDAIPTHGHINMREAKAEDAGNAGTRRCRKGAS